MGRSPFMRNHALWISALATVVGLFFTVLAFLHDGRPSGWMAFYESAVPKGPPEDWNLAVQILAPVVFVSGVWYLWEQISVRREFNQVIELERKSEFNQRLPDLKEEVKKLPQDYEDRLEEKEEDFRSRR